MKQVSKNDVSLDYPPLRAPVAVFETRTASWSRSEAEAFFGWLLDNYRSRAHNLLIFLGRQLPSDSREWEEFLAPANWAVLLNDEQVEEEPNCEAAPAQGVLLGKSVS